MSNTFKCYHYLAYVQHLFKTRMVRIFIYTKKMSVKLLFLTLLQLTIFNIYSTSERCKIGKYTFSLQFNNVFFIYQTFFTNSHLLRLELRCLHRNHTQSCRFDSYLLKRHVFATVLALVLKLIYSQINKGCPPKSVNCKLWARKGMMGYCLFLPLNLEHLGDHIGNLRPHIYLQQR